MKKKQNILLIDRDSETEEMLKKILSKKNYVLKRFSSGRQTLQLIDQIKPQMIFSDLNTDDIDGDVVFIQLKTNSDYVHLSHIPFILFTNAQIKNKKAQKLFNLGLAGLYSKSIQSEELNQIINNLVLSHQVRRRNHELRQEVKRSEFRYRDQLENVNDFIFTLDDQGIFIYLNNRFTPLTGYPKDDWIGKEFLSLIDIKHRSMALEHYQMIHQGRARIFEAQIISNEVDPHTLSFSITPIFEKGQIIGSMGIGRDVTEKKKMENEIINLKNFNESIIQSMEAGLLTINLTKEITSLNTGGSKILDLNPNEVMGKNLTAVLKPEEVSILLSLPNSPKSLRYSRETELTKGDGEKICIGFTATDRIDDKGKKVGTIISFRDITKLKQMQSEVIRMDRLASLGVLASGIAHEIKNPLAGIKTLAQACIEEFTQNDPKKEYLTRIINQVNRLNDLLKTFFAYARPKPPNKKHHSFLVILREVVNLVHKKMENSDIVYKEHIEDNLPDIFIDSQQIQQVLLNLILNSIEAMPDGGSLEIIARPLINHIDKTQSQANSKKDQSKQYIQVLINDSGTGIEKQKLDEIFNPFFTTKPNGLGLGLSIVYRIIEEHQGEISVKSEKGKGTSFQLILPTGDKP